MPSAATDPEHATQTIAQRYAAVSGAHGQQVEALRAFLLQALKKHQDAAEPEPEPLTLQPAIASKEQRTAVHRLFKGIPGFPQLVTTTLETTSTQQDQDGMQQGGSIVQHEGQEQPQQCTADANTRKPQHIQLQMVSSSGCRGQKRKWRQESDWQGGSRRYTKFVLFKENMDSQVSRPATCTWLFLAFGMSLSNLRV